MCLCDVWWLCSNFFLAFHSLHDFHLDALLDFVSFFAFINGRFIFRGVFFSSSLFFFVCLFVSVTVIKMIVNREFCTEFRMRDNTSMHHRCPGWSGVRHIHPARARALTEYLANLRKIYTTHQRRNGKKGQQKQNTVDKCKQQNKMTIQWSA